MVPLPGLGSDQVKKSTWFEKGIKAYHAHEHHCEDVRLLCSWLMNMPKEEIDSTTTILFISSQSLTDQLNETTGVTRLSIWLTAIRKLAQKGHISLMCIDEAHFIE